MSEVITDGSELVELSGTLSERLLEELPWFGIEAELDRGLQGLIKLEPNGLRDLAAIIDALVDPPELDPTSVDSLLWQLRAGSDYEKGAAVEGLLALGAKEAATAILEHAKTQFRAGENVDDLLRMLWLLDPRAAGPLAGAIKEHP